MEKVTFDNVVGFVLATLFALVVGISAWALLIGEYVQPGSVMSDQTRDQIRQTLQIVGYAAALAALVAWWVQQFASGRGFVVRFLFALFVFILAFSSLGGMLRAVFNQLSHPGLLNWTLTDLYWTSLSDFYSFLLFMLVPPRPAYAALILAAAVFLALFGPRGPRRIHA